MMELWFYVEETLIGALIFYYEHPQWLLPLIIGFIVAMSIVRKVARLRWPDRVRREFRRAGIRPSPEQLQTLRDALTTITANETCKKLQDQLQQQSLFQRDQAQLERVSRLANVHVSLVKDVGAALRALEQEYLHQRKALTSEQAREALRLIVEKSVIQITELSDASAKELPAFAPDAAPIARPKRSRPSVNPSPVLVTDKVS